jgi:hypothetical protein
LESIVEENELSQAEAQAMWNEEATKLDAGDQTPAFEAAAPVPETPPQETPEPQAAAPEPEAPVDPLAGLPEEVKIALGKITQLEQANAQLLHHVKTAEGRVAAMQREFQQGRQAATSVDAAPSQGQMAAAAKNPEKWEQLKQDFPEWAGAMEEYVGSKLSGMEPGVKATDIVEYVQRQIAAERETMKVAIEEARVEGKYENWRDTVNTPDFAAWYALQPAEVKALADSTAARDAIRMLDLFHVAKAKPASEIKQERGARLAAAATTRPGQTPPPKTLDDMSPEEVWNYEAKRREEQLAKRGY